MQQLAFNQVVLSGEITAIDTVRYTPAGVPKVTLSLRHHSQQIEAGGLRKVSCDIATCAFGKIAEQAAQFSVGQAVKVQGFIAQQSLRSRQLVLHINDIILE